MSTVIPNGQIRFLTGVPIDKDYQNELDFLTKDAQTSYFLGLTPVHIMTGSTRVREGVVTVNCGADTILSANYMMFKNMNFFDKWFYAFITNIEYVNTNACNVYYAIDDIQTWLFDVELEECFVEREHTPTDNMYEHIIDEGFSVADYVEQSRTSEDLVADTLLMFSTSFMRYNEGGWEKKDDFFVRVREGNLSGIGAFGYKYRKDINNHEIDTDMCTTLTTIFQRMVEENSYENILGCVAIPSKFLNSVPQAPTYEVDTNSEAESITLPFPVQTSSIDGYIPKNKKMYNAPYCVFKLGSSDGQNVSLQPQLFEFSPAVQGNCNARISADISPNPSVLAYPIKYGGQQQNFEKSLNYDCFPQVPFGIDGYKAWIASGGMSKLAFSTAKNIAGDVTGGLIASAFKASVNPVGAGLGALSGSLGVFTDVWDACKSMNIAERLPNDVKGNLTSAPQQSHKDARIFVSYNTVKADIARSFDEYFTMYGYKVNRVKVPNRRNRPHYTYLKTKGCKVIGGAPADALERIQAIYDNGIRFWVNASEVGKFSTVDNRPA